MPDASAIVMHDIACESPSRMQWSSFEDGIPHLSRMRNSNGLFPEIEADLRTGMCHRTPGIFSAGLVGMLLRSFPISADTKRLRRELAEALMAVRNRDGTWSFEGPFGRFPADVDDTAVALAATHCLRNAKHDLSGLLERITFSPEGLARTWVKPRMDRSNVIDIVVNLHLAASLRHTGLGSRPLKTAISKALRGGRTKNTYYTSRIPVLFAIQEAMPHRRVALSTNIGLNHMLDSAEHFWSDTVEQPESVRFTSLFRRRSAEVYYTSPAVVMTYALMLQCSGSFANQEITA